MATRKTRTELERIEVDPAAFAERARRVIIDARNRFGRRIEPPFFEQLRRTGCRFVVGGGARPHVLDYVLCGAPTLGLESPWCAEHARVVLAGFPERRR